MHAQPCLILASSSIYRRELLERLQIAFSTQSPDIDETPLIDESATQTAARLARQKAEAVGLAKPGSVVIGSDQVATLDGEQIGKPGSHIAALAQLKKMQGRQVLFHTALCVLDTRTEAAIRLQQVIVDTTVMFRTLAERQLEAYLHIEQPYDVAGSAKNEALGITLIESITSTDPTALTGLPLIALTGMLMQVGVEFFACKPPRTAR